MLCEIVIQSSTYREEGALLYWDAFLTNNIEELLVPVPDHHILRLGAVSPDEGGVAKALKRAAPLAQGSWKLYISSGQDGSLEYGLFRDSAHPLTVPIAVALQGGGHPYVRVRKLAEGTVEVSTHEQVRQLVNLTNSKDATDQTEEHLMQLAQVICGKVDAAIHDSVKTYVVTLLSKAIHASHGCLIGVLGSQKIPSLLKDCVALQPPLDLVKIVAQVKSSAQHIPEMQALESIVLGVFGSDGIVLFDDKANVVAYNTFIKVKASNVAGGARKRAYSALESSLGRQVKAAFYQSQDGNSAIKVHANE